MDQPRVSSNFQHMFSAVAVLFVMHVAIAVVTYNALVHLAPVRAARRPAGHRMQPVGR